MLQKASIEKAKGNEFSNTARDAIKSMLNNYNFTKEGENLVLESSDTINHFIKAIPLFLAEVLKDYRSQSIVAETTGAGGSDQVSQAVTTDHTLEGHLVDIIGMIPPKPSTLPVTSVADRYTRSMLKCLAGYPLYTPKPFSELSKEYPRNGVNIGDVGFVRGNGSFDFLFNICPSKNMINPPNLPDGFSLDTPHQLTTRDRELFPHNTSLFQRPITRTNSGEYICEGSEGAVLELPEGAMLYEATNMPPFEKLAALHGVEWYEYTMTRGRKVSNGSLYLITSCTKCTQWGTAVFDRKCASGQGLSFNNNKSRPVDRSAAKYQWKGSRAFATKNFDPNKGDASNQCVFLGGYKIMIRQDIFDNLYNNRLRGTDPAMPSSSHQAGSSRLTRHQATRSSGGGGTDSMSRTLTGGGSSMIKSDEVILFANFNSSIIHPSDLINGALLRQNPDAKVALTHDDVWCNLMRDNFPKLNYATLIDIARSYTIIVDEYDCVSLTKTSDSSKVLDRSSRPLSEDYAPVSSLVSRTFPRELVQRIFLFLDAKSMLTCRFVNRRFNEIILSSTLLQYVLACKAADVIDNRRSTTTYAQRLDALEKREDAWRTLKPLFEMTIKVNHQQSESLLYGLTEGAYFLDDYNQKDWHYCQLPSSPQDNPQWIRIQDHGPEEGRPENFVNFATAVYEHDLIIKIISSDIGDQAEVQRYSLDLVLLEFSTGEYHPLARNPRIHVQRSPSAEFLVSPTVVGDNFALVVHSEDGTVPDKLFIFDWKTGHKRLQHETIENAYSDLVFVSPEILLVPNLLRSHFEVWHLPPSPPNPKPPFQILALQIPVISPAYSLVSISCDGKPTPFLHSMPYFSPRPFFPSSENSIIVASLRFSSPSRSSYTLVMHRRALLDTIEKWTSPSVVEQEEDLSTWLTNEVTVHNTADPEDGSVRVSAQSQLVSVIPHPRPSPGTCDAPTSPTSSSALSTIPSLSRYSFLQVKWADWGPPISRWFQVKEIQAQFITSFGQRCAFLFPNPRNRRKSMVTVVDFNPHNFRRNASVKPCLRGGEGEDKGGNSNNEDAKEKEDEDELEKLDHEGVFSEEVYMRLKCVIYHAPDQYDFDQLLMDEERLLGLKVNRQQNVKHIKVLYFG